MSAGSTEPLDGPQQLLTLSFLPSGPVPIQLVAGILHRTGALIFEMLLAFLERG
jgi:hypothetical protein